MEGSHEKLTSLTSDVVAAYVSNNAVTASDLPSLIASVHAAFTQAGKPAAEGPVGPERPNAAAVRKSITPDHLVSFEDGKPYRTLKRHLTGRGLTPYDYRTKWSLPADYPMTAASYTARRSELARTLGLGRKRKTVTEPATPTVVAKPKRQSKKALQEV